MTATTAGIEAFCHSLEAVSGLRYDASKAYLFESRLRGVFPEGVPSYAALAMLVRAGGEPARRIVEALVTHETYFFRDEGTFKLLPDLVSAAVKAGGSAPVVWSLGCATGQEIWSILIAIDEAGRLPATALRPIGVDISSAALARAREATYSDFEVGRGLSEARRDRYFERVAGGWRVARPWRDVPVWVQGNLLDDLTMLPRPDVVFCRNVLIYFDDPLKRQIMGRIAARLAPGGCIVLGNAESALLYADILTPQTVGTGVLRLPASQPSPR